MKLLLTFLMGLSLFIAHGQSKEFGFSISYQYLQAKEWNRGIQTYNFARPFLTEKQPLLRHGLRLGAYLLLDTSNPFSWGPSASISFHQSRADNNNFNIGIQSFLVDVGMKLQYRPSIGDNNPLHFSITPNITGVYLARKLDGELIVIEDDEEEENAVRSLGLGFGFNTKLGYDLSGNSLLISPFIGFDYSPITWGNKSDIVFNEAAVAGINNTTSLLRWQLGVLLRKP